MITEQIVEAEPECRLDPTEELSFILLGDGGEKITSLAVTVKSLTTAGIIVDVLPQEDGLRPENLKGREGLLTGVGFPDCGLLKAPARILWARQRQDEAGVTLGLELQEPLPLAVRQALEANMAIGARDMKVLWDYWDELQESARPALAVPPAPIKSRAPEVILPRRPVPEPHEGHNLWPYFIGFGTIIAGLVMLLPRSDIMGFSGLGMMVLGSLIIALRSIGSMREASTSRRTR